jgi:hypothetical protein
MLRILPPEVVQLIAQLLLNAVQSSEETSGFGILLALLVALYAGGNRRDREGRPLYLDDPYRRRAGGDALPLWAIA